MLHPIISDYKRLLSLAYIDNKGEFYKISLCVVKDDDMEHVFRKDFDTQGILYNKIITENSINPNTVTHMRIISEPIRYIESFVSWD